ncbi:uncharacterized protein FIBRA_01655 [Fibroporia radiculosa]|uniref:Ras modification protein ERF4 n=1 Tax=Fibroporia radiculosa TaxID=599839 RepID=J4GKX3_9APHY|nr:uncharacterized protein FIBRA_01655 [Fibroporia radiculosa]CCL99635.1 predicted protein [Fibroporia radiculosa]
MATPQRSPSASSHAGSLEAHPRELDADPAEETVATGGSGEGCSDGAGTRVSFPGEGSELAQKMAMMGLRVTPPDMLPPSPPLTPLNVDSSARPSPPGTQEGNMSSAHAHTHEDDEDDITNLRTSWAEDDLGSVTSNSKASSPSADHVVRSLFGSGQPSRSQGTQEHPLRSPSPPLWEQIGPPPDRQPDLYGSSNTRVAQEFSSSKPLRSRPLIPYSSYYFGPPPRDAAFGTPPVGQIGVHHPREIVRIERDYSGGELPQFAPVYPLEIEGRVNPTQFLETINAINEVLLSAHSVPHSFAENTLAFFSLQLSRAVFTSHYEKEMQRLEHLIDDINTRVFNPVGMNILWPRKVAFLFLEIEYYVSLPSSGSTLWTPES